MATYYCNVWMLCNDSSLCDLGLLQKVLVLVKSRQVTIMTSPACGGDRHCLAIPLEIAAPISGTIAGGISDNLFRMAEEKGGTMDHRLSPHRKSSFLSLASIPFHWLGRLWKASLAEVPGDLVF
jgi:hypothetical protein